MCTRTVPRKVRATDQEKGKNGHTFPLFGRCPEHSVPSPKVIACLNGEEYGCGQTGRRCTISKQEVAGGLTTRKGLKRVYSSIMRIMGCAYYGYAYYGYIMYLYLYVGSAIECTDRFRHLFNLQPPSTTICPCSFYVLVHTVQFSAVQKYCTSIKTPPLFLPP